MNLDTRDLHQSASAALRVENEALLIERLRAFGLIESDGRGGWRMTECCESGLAALEPDQRKSPQSPLTIIRPWTPRKA